MRIVQAIESSGPGGAEQVVVQLCRELHLRGHHVEVLLLRPGWLKRQLERDGVEVSVLAIRRSLDPGLFGALRRHLVTRRVDVLHSHEFTFGLYGAAATIGIPAVHVATAHGANFARNRKRLALGRALFRRRGRFRLVTVCEALAKRLRPGFKLDGTALEVIVNGIECPAGVERERRDPARPFQLIAVGNLYPVKNHQLTIRAVRGLLDRGFDVRLRILGRGAEQAALETLIGELDLGPFVTLEGFRADVDSFIRRSDLLVSSSLSEGIPISFLEAMAQGLPVVASRVGGVPEIVADGQDGQLFDSGDLDGLISALARLAGDPRFCERLGMNAAASVRERFTVREMADRYEALYRRLGSRER